MRAHLAAALALLAAVVAAPPAAAQSSLPECPGADVAVTRDAARAEGAVLCIVNAERAARGLPPLAAEGRLDAAAQGHSDDMAARDFFDHDTPEGRTSADRATAAGYPWSTLYENIAAGQTTAREAMLGWIQSTGHCQAVLAPEPVHLGVGLAPDSPQGPLWTQVFGLPQDTPPASQDTAPAAGCPYQRLSIAPGPAQVFITYLRRTATRVTVSGRLQDEDAGRRIVVEARRAGRTARRRVLTVSGGSFRATLPAPRGRGRVTVTVTAPAVPDVYKAGSDTRRV